MNTFTEFKFTFTEFTFAEFKLSGFSYVKKCHPDNRIENDMEE